jgi:hypothetical protein
VFEDGGGLAGYSGSGRNGSWIGFLRLELGLELENTRISLYYYSSDSCEILIDNELWCQFFS